MLTLGCWKASILSSVNNRVSCLPCQRLPIDGMSTKSKNKKSYYWTKDFCAPTYYPFERNFNFIIERRCTEIRESDVNLVEISTRSQGAQKVFLI